MTPSFWRGRRVFLTGHTGFKGSWLSLWLQQLGAELSGFALPPSTQPILFEEARVAQGMHSVIGDVRDFETLRQALQAARPQVVIHLAAQALVREGYRDPVATYATNVLGTAHLMEAVRTTPDVQAVLVVTSDKCYANEESGRAYREGDALGGHDPYSSSKACAELVSASYRDSFFPPAEHARHGVGVATARAGNVIGGGDWAADRLIPDVLAAFARGEPVSIRRPDAVRPWQHVLEPLRGYLMLAEQLCLQGPAFAQAWNFGPRAGDARPVRAVVEQLAELWGDGASWNIDGQIHPHEAGLLNLDISHAREHLAWEPRLNLSQALGLVVEWQRRRERKDDVRALTCAQISRYSTGPQA